MGSTPSAALVLVELRLPAFQRGTAVRGAHGLTEHFSDLHPHRQTFVPSAARQPGSRRLPGRSLPRSGNDVPYTDDRPDI